MLEFIEKNWKWLLPTFVVIGIITYMWNGYA